MCHLPFSDGKTNLNLFVLSKLKIPSSIHDTAPFAEGNVLSVSVFLGPRNVYNTSELWKALSRLEIHTKNFAIDDKYPR